MNTPNQSAFPLSVEHGLTSEASIGLTKREYFAGIALQTLASDATQWKNMMMDRRGVPANEYVAKQAIELADELLKQLEK